MNEIRDERNLTRSEQALMIRLQEVERECDQARAARDSYRVHRDQMERERDEARAQVEATLDDLRRAGRLCDEALAQRDDARFLLQTSEKGWQAAVSDIDVAYREVDTVTQQQGRLIEALKSVRHSVVQHMQDGHAAASVIGEIDDVLAEVEEGY